MIAHVKSKAGRGKHKAKSPSTFSYMADEESELWCAYIRSRRSVPDRNALVDYYYKRVLVSIAISVGKRNRLPVEYDDLIANGSIGLIRAIERFDPERRIRFATYAHSLIFGAIVDSMRSDDPVPRLARQHSALLAKAEEKVAGCGDDDKRDLRLVRALRITKDELRQWKADRALCNVKTMSLDATVLTESGRSVWSEVTYASFVRDDHAPEGDSSEMTSEWWGRILAGLNEVEMAILCLYYVHSWTMKQIGLHLGISESRISQMSSRIIEFLKRYRSKSDFSDIPGWQVRRMRLIDILPFCRRERIRRGVRRSILRQDDCRKPMAA